MAQPTLKMIEEEIENGHPLILPGATTASPPLRLLVGATPTNPQDGDVWYDGTALKIRIGVTTRTVTVT